MVKNMMDLDYVDGDGNLLLTYDVSVSCNGKRAFHLGSGSSAVCDFYDLVSKRKINATNIEYLWGYNVLVTMSGAAFLDMVENWYPELYKSALKHIDPEKEYVIDCYDMS